MVADTPSSSEEVLPASGARGIKLPKADYVYAANTPSYQGDGDRQPNGGAQTRFANQKGQAKSCNKRQRRVGAALFHSP
jgi:hypothetical protein